MRKYITLPANRVSTPDLAPWLGLGGSISPMGEIPNCVAPQNCTAVSGVQDRALGGATLLGPPAGKGAPAGVCVL